ncbi:hypothetical protein M3226_11050 [Neobacillus cucumis]|nr:hypothetical protein [Neobacillus cucumis]MCM3726221.1 hypothetical protein [Neobacillus cucumis]
MELAGGTTDDIAYLSVSSTDREYDRPARHTSVKNLREGLRVQIEMTAVL